MLDFSKKILVLAPLAGYTDLPFRSVVKKFGADLTVSEMISSNALLYNSKKTLKMVEKSPNETPYSVQIAGNSINIIKEATILLNQFNFIDIIDLNSGCPAPKVVNHGSGSSLLKDLNLLFDIVKTIKTHTSKKHVSVKMRLGFTHKNHIDIAKTIEDAGADFIAVHGRTRADGYKKERIDYDSIAEIKEAVSIPIIANGEIDSYEKANFVFNHTKADGIMIGRGAIGSPWIFHQIKNREEVANKNIKKDIIVEHFDKMYEFYGEYGITLFRKHLHSYSKGYSEASKFREFVNRCEDGEVLRAEIINFFENSEYKIKD